MSYSFTGEIVVEKNRGKSEFATEVFPIPFEFFSDPTISSGVTTDASPPPPIRTSRLPERGLSRQQGWLGGFSGTAWEVPEIKNRRHTLLLKNGGQLLIVGVYNAVVVKLNIYVIKRTLTEVGIGNYRGAGTGTREYRGTKPVSISSHGKSSCYRQFDNARVFLWAEVSW